MDNTARTSFSFARQEQAFPGQFNAAFVTITNYFFQEHRVPPIIVQTTFAFLVPVLLDFLQLMYQGKGVSPFETHPKTMLVAIVSLLMYRCAYDAEVRFSSTHPSSSAYTRAIRGSIMLFGLLAVASLASVLFPPYISPVIYLIYLTLAAVGVLRSRLQVIWNWLHQKIMEEPPSNIHIYFINPILEAVKKMRCGLQRVWNWLHRKIMGEHSGSVLPVSLNQIS